MNRLRKIANWFWLSKERMVLAIMVGFLCFRVYQVVKPPPIEREKSYHPPRSEISDDVITPGQPPREPGLPPTDDWSRIYRRNPFLWVRPGTRNAGRTGSNNADIDLELLSVQETPNGEYRAQIRTGGRRRGWYEEGEAFEAYTLLSIDPDDPDGPCVEVFSEELTKRVRICIKK